jgi:hypothetical protein
MSKRPFAIAGLIILTACAPPSQHPATTPATTAGVNQNSGHALAETTVPAPSPTSTTPADQAVLEPAVAVPAPVQQTQPVPSPPPPAPRPALASETDQCHPSYQGECVPITSDVDCLGGSGNGPAYVGQVRVVGPDEYDLDRDGNGVGCERD